MSLKSVQAAEIRRKAEQCRGLAATIVVPGDTAMTYAAACWHHAMIALDRPACFSVLMWRDGTAADMETVTLGESFELCE